VRVRSGSALVIEVGEEMEAVLMLETRWLKQS
jgi:hypothetical protein